MNSLIIAASATVVSTVLGTLAAYALWKRRSPLLTTSLYLSLLTPEIVTGVSLLAFFEWIFRYLHVQLGMHTVILAHISFSLVYVVIVVLARLRTFDVSLEEAALDLGATEWQVFRHVTVPMLLPGIAAAALLCFTVSFDDYVITSLVAGVNSETLPMVIYGMARRGVSPEVNALSVMITVALGISDFAGRAARTKLRHEARRSLNRRLFLMGSRARHWLHLRPRLGDSTSTTGKITSPARPFRTSSVSSTAAFATPLTEARKRCSRK